MPFNPKLLENLKPEKRSQDKQRRNFTLLPATVEWLGKQPNASAAIDRLVAVASDSDSEVIPFHEFLKQAWRFVATEQVSSGQIEGHPVGLKELHDRCFPYLKWEGFLDLVEYSRSQLARTSSLKTYTT
jgi:hypothetical protein